MDDFHNIHEYRRSDTTTTHEVSHFITILLKALPEMASIPFYNPNREGSEGSVYNQRGIDESIIIQNAHTSFFSETHDERVERLLIHSYDDRIEQR